MNKFNNPRLTNTTVSGTGVKHPMRPHVILGDPENGFIRGDLLDANAVIKLIKNAAKAIGALEELEQSNWIDDNAKTDDNTTIEEQYGVLQPGEVGFVQGLGQEKIVAYNDNGNLKDVAYAQGASNHSMNIVDAKAFGKTLRSAYEAGYIVVNESASPSEFVSYSTLLNKVIKNKTVAIDGVIPVS